MNIFVGQGFVDEGGRSARSVGVRKRCVFQMKKKSLARSLPVEMEEWKRGKSGRVEKWATSEKWNCGKVGKWKQRKPVRKWKVEQITQHNSKTIRFEFR